MTIIIKFVCGCLFVVAAGYSSASTFPDRPVTIVVPYSPGGVTDLFARAIANKLTQIWGRPVLVTNQGGGGTIIGTQFVSRAPQDGHTILLTSYAFTSNPVLRKNLPYDPATLTPLLLLGNSSSLLVVGRVSPLITLKDVVEHAKSGPGALTLASSGNASSPHIAAELFAAATGVEIAHIPYKGTAPAMNDVLGGQVNGIFDGPSAMSNVRAGKLRAIAIAAATRLPAAPEVPTFRELGVDLVFGSWFGFFVPTGTPQATQKQLFADLRSAIDDPAVHNSISKAGLRIYLGSQEQFQEFLKSETELFRSLVQSSGAKFFVE